MPKDPKPKDPKLHSNPKSHEASHQPESLFSAFTLEEVATRIKKGATKNIIVMTGAGISVDAGIPDFRSPGTGLYSQLEKYNLPEPEAVFDIEFFKTNPEPFWILAKEMWPGNFAPTDVHLFIKLLADKGLLLRNYTQNIDCLERAAGIPGDLIVEAHGSFASASTIGKYSRPFPIESIKEELDKGCTDIRHPDTGALVKPDIVFFGEDLPQRFNLCRKDFPQCDLLIVIGTSLQVTPFADLTQDVPRSCPRLLINREHAGDFRFNGRHNYRDVGALGDCQVLVNKLVDLLDWRQEFNVLRDQFPDRPHHKDPQPIPFLHGLGLKPKMPDLSRLSI